MFPPSHWFTPHSLRIGRFELVVWPEWRGLVRRRWTGPLARVVRLSIYIGWLELRWWQRQNHNGDFC